MPSGRNYQAPNIDWTKPVRTVPIRAKGKCPVCKKESFAKLNIKGNVNTEVSGHCFAKCAGKKCPRQPEIKLTFKVKIT